MGEVSEAAMGGPRKICAGSQISSFRESGSRAGGGALSRCTSERTRLNLELGGPGARGLGVFHALRARLSASVARAARRYRSS